MSYFEVFGLPRRLLIDGEALRERFYELSRRHHPDFHQAAPPEDQARALEASARLNAAYRALRDPIGRIEYLVRLEEGRETKEGAAAKQAAPPELLEEIFEIQEGLEAARGGGLDAVGRAALAAHRDRLLARCREEEARLTGPLSSEWDAAAPAERPRVVRRLGAGLATRAYLRAVIDDLSVALGEDQDVHVAHHRD